MIFSSGHSRCDTIRVLFSHFDWLSIKALEIIHFPFPGWCHSIFTPCHWFTLRSMRLIPGTRKSWKASPVISLSTDENEHQILAKDEFILLNLTVVRNLVAWFIELKDEIMRDVCIMMNCVRFRMAWINFLLHFLSDIYFLLIWEYSLPFRSIPLPRRRRSAPASQLYVQLDFLSCISI